MIVLRGFISAWSWNLTFCTNCSFFEITLFAEKDIEAVATWGVENQLQSMAYQCIPCVNLSLYNITLVNNSLHKKVSQGYELWVIQHNLKASEP